MSSWARPDRRYRCRGTRALLAAALLWLLPSVAGAQSGKPAKDDDSDIFFRSGQIPRLVIELSDDACEKLRKEPRKYAGGKLRENDRNVFEEVVFKLKGAAGSFREFDDIPSFTVKMDKGDDDQKFHGLRKFQLNKSPQDDTYLHELLGSEIFRAAGVLTPRVTHARVWINKRDMGLYVVKEGFDRVLLKRGFDKSGGSLYDGGFCQDIDADLEKDEGPDPDDRADLKALLDCCREPDLVKRWAKLPQLVDLKAFITFMAVELMLGHWDGYCLNANNYRLYFDPQSGKAFFLPHGMDQLFGDAEASILDNPGAILANAVMRNPAWRADFRKRVTELLPLFSADRLKLRVDEVAKRLHPVLEAYNKDAADAHEAAVDGLKARLEAREKSLKEQRGMPDPRPLVFQAGQPVRLTKWRTNSECEDAELTQEKENGVDLMNIAAGPSGRCVASWRRGVLLPRGKYRFHAMLAAKDIAALEGDEDAPGVGGGLRLSGGTRENSVVGSIVFKAVEFEFEVTEEQADVELVVELRASKGRLAVRADTLFLTKLGK
ncbi:MAG: CotH kinase family protein [Planctomycetes bacterium]|nr:CotH kinase family protein [Planctomycetota bacterium]